MTNECEKYKTSRLSDSELRELAERLNIYMEENKVYLNPKFRMNQLSEGLKIRNHTLSQVINRHYQKSFFEFINSFRIKKAIEQITKNASVKMKIETVGNFCGFNTRTTFVKAFKVHTGVSPSEYKLKIMSKLKNN